MTTSLLLPDERALADLATFLGRAKRVDPDGAARLVARADVLAVYVSPVHGAGGPTVLGLRTLRLAEAVDLDVTVPLVALGDRFARVDRGTAPGGAGLPADGGPAALAVPPAPATGVAWAGISPPRSGWEPVGLLEPALVVQAARAGIEEIAAGVPEGSGAAAVARLRALVWGRPLADLDDVPAGLAFAAVSLGFVGDAEADPATLLRHGSWSRLSTSRGHVLARRSLL